MIPLFVRGGIKGAGFCSVDKNLKVTAYGESIGLSIPSRPEDANIVAKAMGITQY